MKKNAVARLFELARAVSAWNARGRNFELDQVIGPRSARGGIGMPVLSDTGFSNIDRTHIFGGTLGMAYAPAWHTFFDDFDKYAAGDWTITDTGGGAAGTSALVTTLSALQVKNDNAGINELRQHQLVPQSFLYTVGKPLLFSCRVKVNDATKGQFLVGLQKTSANAFGPPTDGIYFNKGSAANTHLDVTVRGAGVSTTAADVAEAADDTYVELNFVYDGEKGIDYGVNGKKLGSIVLTNAPAAQQISPVFAVKNGEAVAKLITVDWVFVAQAR